MYYQLNGIPVDVPGDQFWVIEEEFEFVLKSGDLTPEINAACIKLTKSLAERILGNEEERARIESTINIVDCFGGIDAEGRVSRSDFEKYINENTHLPDKNKVWYYCDVASLIGSLQTAVIESKYIFGNFFKTLNAKSFLAQENLYVVQNGLQNATGPIVTNVFSCLNHLFINLCSQLDFATKICYEIDYLPSDFSTYPKMKAKDIDFGKAKRLSIFGSEGSVFDSSVDVNLIVILRNEIVHNASLDCYPKVYQVIENNKIVEKYILMPDTANGYVQTFKNRRRFFDDDNKVNQMLPEIISGFWKKIYQTIQHIESRLHLKSA